MTGFSTGQLVAISPSRPCGQCRYCQAGLQNQCLLVQLGLGSEIRFPPNTVVTKALEIRGSSRFHEEFGLAIDLINSRRVDLKPLLTSIVPLEEARTGFDMAMDRPRAMKVQIAF